MNKHNNGHADKTPNSPRRKISAFWFGFRQGMTAAGRVYPESWPEYPEEEQEEIQQQSRQEAASGHE